MGRRLLRKRRGKARPLRSKMQSENEARRRWDPNDQRRLPFFAGYHCILALPRIAGETFWSGDRSISLLYIAWCCHAGVVVHVQHCFTEHTECCTCGERQHSSQILPSAIEYGLLLLQVSHEAFLYPLMTSLTFLSKSYQ